MTDREKAVVMAYTGFAMLTGEKLGIFYAYVREILGRPVWTHELAIKEVSAEIHEKSEKDFLELCASEDSKKLACQDETGMDERTKKVCNGLNCHVNGHPHTRCHKCPYWGTGPHGSSECSVLAADALSLIRQQTEKIHELQTIIHELQTAQTARVMSLEETDNAEVAWLEEYADPADGVGPIIQPVIIVWHENGCWHCLIDRNEDAGLDLFIDGLWTEWRFWTQRSTDEQRKAVKWDG